MPERERPRLYRVPAMVALGQTLKLLRGTRPQRDVAQAAGISRGYLSELEQGKRPYPRPRTLENLAVVLGTRLEALQPPEPSEAGEALVATEPGGQPPDVHNATVVLTAAGAAPAATFRVYRWGTEGDPTDPEDAPAPLAYEWVPRGSESVVGLDGFSIIVRGDGLRGWRVRDGDQCIVNPRQPVRVGHLVAAYILNGDGEGGMGVYELAEGPARPDGSRGTVLRSWPERARPIVVAVRRFRILGPVVQILSLRSPDEGRPRRLDADELEEQRYGPTTRADPEPQGPEPRPQREPPATPGRFAPPSCCSRIAQGVLYATFLGGWPLSGELLRTL